MIGETIGETNEETIGERIPSKNISKIEIATTFPLDRKLLRAEASVTKLPMRKIANDAKDTKNGEGVVEKSRRKRKPRIVEETPSNQHRYREGRSIK